MATTIVYRAESVGPVLRRLAEHDDRLRVIHEDDLPAQRLISPPPPPTTAPADPLLAVWERASDAAEAFSQLEPTRSPLALEGISELVVHLQNVRDTAARPAPVAPPPQPRRLNALVRWGSIAEANADVTINSSASVRIARDKRQSRQVLAGLCPPTWIQRNLIQTPCVIRPRRHHAGSRFFVCRNQAEIERAINRCGPGWYASQLIQKAHEYRVFVLQGRAVAVSERFPASPTEVAWNLAAGGRLINVRRNDWPLEACKASIRAAGMAGLDWSAVDVCVDNNNRVYVLELNTAPGLKNQYTMGQIAWALGSVTENPTLPRLALDSPALSWRELLHPSLIRTAEER